MESRGHEAKKLSGQLARFAGYLALAVSIAAPAYAGPLEDTCDLVFAKLDSGPRDALTRAIETFTDDGKSYRGCVIRFTGRTDKMSKLQEAGSLLGTSMPSCPEGKIHPDLPDYLRNENGWCGNLFGDGPDGTFYRALKEDVFCIVDGKWDGGDDSDPTYVRATRYDIQVMCAHRQP